MQFFGQVSLIRAHSSHLQTPRKVQHLSLTVWCFLGIFPYTHEMAIHLLAFMAISLKHLSPLLSICLPPDCPKWVSSSGTFQSIWTLSKPPVSWPPPGSPQRWWVSVGAAQVEVASAYAKLTWGRFWKQLFFFYRKPVDIVSFKFIYIYIHFFVALF